LRYQPFSVLLFGTTGRKPKQPPGVIEHGQERYNKKVQVLEGRYGDVSEGMVSQEREED
jgi:hypothetical protein